MSEINEMSECAWCGADRPSVPPRCGGDRRWFQNRRGETFCSRSHREESNAALRRLQRGVPERDLLLARVARLEALLARVARLEAEVVKAGRVTQRRLAKEGK